MPSSIRLLALIAVAAATIAAAPPNQINDAILAAPTDQRARFLGGLLGAGCQGTEAYYVGVAGAGPSAGVATWDVRCADGRSFSTGIGPDGNGTPSIIDCAQLKAAGGGECFKPRQR